METLVFGVLLAAQVTAGEAQEEAPVDEVIGCCVPGQACISTTPQSCWELLEEYELRSAPPPRAPVRSRTIAEQEAEVFDAFPTCRVEVVACGMTYLTDFVGVVQHCSTRVVPSARNECSVGADGYLHVNWQKFSMRKRLAPSTILHEPLEGTVFDVALMDSSEILGRDSAPIVVAAKPFAGRRTR